MSNMDIYNLLKSVPTEAKKTISAGRLKGMTDIKPMWRIEKLTEVFGPCGKGWMTNIKNKEIIDGVNGEKIAIVDINLYVKYEGKSEWSEPIEGTGGSKFISREKNGLYVDDECFKKAYTDAISVACKSLGMGADVYWGDSKYKNTPEVNKQMTLEEAENYRFTWGRHNGEKIKDVIGKDDNYLSWLATKNENIKMILNIIKKEGK